jgi:signal transduction histidine kinase
MTEKFIKKGPASGRLKIFLLALAFCIMAGTLFYTHYLVEGLQEKEKEIAGLYARSIEFLAAEGNSSGDISFVFEQVMTTIDFPLIQTDADNEPIWPYESYCRNVDLDRSLSADRQRTWILDVIREMDAINSPIAVSYQGKVLNRVHYGESPLVKRLRWLPFIEFVVAALFILIGYISFSYIKRNEQSNIWVGMARETAHQLGTPLSSMMGWSELLKVQAGNSPQLQDTLKDMDADLKRLQKIADRFSKIGSKPDLRMENLSDVVSHVFEYFRRRIPRTGKKVALEFHTEGEVFAPINAELFEWVIENLIKNSLDAIEQGEGKISVDVSHDDDHIYIDVIDTGKGVDTVFRKDIFRPGFSTKKRGWGLGLSLAKRVVENYHQGTLLLKESVVGKGTTFRIILRK